MRTILQIRMTVGVDPEMGDGGTSTGIDGEDWRLPGHPSLPLNDPSSLLV
jgi:hypothetical protein